MTQYKSSFKGTQIDEGVGKGRTVGDVALLNTTDKSSVVGAVNEIVTANLKNLSMPTYDDQTYKLTFKTNDGATMVVDLPIESLAANLDYDHVNKALLIKKEDGSVISVSVADLVDVYHGSTGSHIQITIGTNNTLQATLLDGSIGDDKLAAVIVNKINAAYNHSQTLGNPHDTKCSFGAKWTKTGLNVVVNQGTSYNLLQTLNLVSDLTFVGNVLASSFVMVNPGTANALLRLPNLNKFVDYVISIRLTGTFGSSGSDVAEFFVDLQRADGSLVDGKSIIKNIDNQLSKRGINIETASLDSADNFIVSGVKFVINNPSQGSRTVTLTGYEILIKGNI